MNTSLIVVLCISITSLVVSIVAIARRCNKDNYVSTKSPNNNFIRYTETSGLLAGPITVEFSLVAVITPTGCTDACVPQTFIQAYRIDNNGQGYSSLEDLFEGGATLNTKIVDCLSDASKTDSNTSFVDRINPSYFTSSAYTCAKDSVGSAPFCNKKEHMEGLGIAAITIGQFIINFGSGTSTVLSNTNEDTGNLPGTFIGGAWGPPKIFEIGGERYNKSFTPQATSNAPLVTLPPGFWPDGDTNSTNLHIPLQFSEIRMVGSGQGSTMIRGSAMFIFYDVRDMSVPVDERWMSLPTFKAFGDNRIVVSGFFWAGHLGISTDYNNNLLNTKLKTNLLVQKNIQIGNTGFVDSAAGAPYPIEIPMYELASSSASLNNTPTACPFSTKGKSACPMTTAAQLPADGGVAMTSQYVEIICTDLWIELKANTIVGATLPVRYLYYPLFFLSVIGSQRYFLSNVNVFTYQAPAPPNPTTPGSGCKGTTYFATGFVNKNSLFPADTFIQNCSFAGRAAPDPGYSIISARFYNSDKISVVNCTFHGQLIVNCNKLAMFNCYCLNVGKPNTLDNCIVNPGVIFIDSGAPSKSGLQHLKTSQRIIFQNMVFVIHVDGDALTSAVGDLATATATLPELARAKLFSQETSSGDFYFNGGKNNLFPFYITTNPDGTCTPSQTQLGKTISSIKRVFFDGVSYYGVFLYADSAPTFSAIKLSSIETVQVVTTSYTDQMYGTSL